MATITRKQSDLPLQCKLAGSAANVHITGATSTDSAGNSKNLTIAGDDQSFQIPAEPNGMFVVVAVVDRIPAGSLPELRAGDDNTLLDIFDDPATLAADFHLVVTP